MPNRVSLSTDQIEPERSDEFWREISRPLFDVAPLDPSDQALRGAFTSRPVGGLTIAETHFNAQRYSRNQRTIIESGLDSYLVQLLIAGSLRGDCDGRCVTAEPGDICIFDLARPYITHADAGSRITVSVPRRRVDQAAGRRSMHGLVLKSNDPLNRLLRGLLLSLHDLGDSFAESDAVVAETAFVEMLAAIVSRRRLELSPTSNTPTSRLRQRIEEFLDAHLSDPALSVGSLAREFQISRAHLYRMFPEDGGIASLIRNRRLAMAFQRLRDDEGMSISQIAFEQGFSSSAQFARAFRNRFAMAPSDVKMNMDAGSSSSDDIRSLQSHLVNQKRLWLNG